MGYAKTPETATSWACQKEEVQEEDAQMCPCGSAKERRTHTVGESEMYKEKRDVLER